MRGEGGEETGVRRGHGTNHQPPPWRIFIVGVPWEKVRELFSSRLCRLCSKGACLEQRKEGNQPAFH